MVNRGRIALERLATARVRVCTGDTALLRLLQWLTGRQQIDAIAHSVLCWASDACIPPTLQTETQMVLEGMTYGKPYAGKIGNTRPYFSSEEIGQIDATMVAYGITATDQPSSKLRPQCMLYLCSAYILHTLWQKNTPTIMPKRLTGALQGLYYGTMPAEQGNRITKPLQGLGSKSDPVFDPIITELMLQAYRAGKRTFIEPCLGYVGVQPLTRLTTYLTAEEMKDVRWWGNDYEIAKVNYYNILKKPRKLKKAMRLAVRAVRNYIAGGTEHWYNAATCNSMKAIIEETLTASNTPQDVIDGLRTYCDYWISIPSRHTLSAFVGRLERYIESMDDMQHIVKQCRLESKDATYYIDGILSRRRIRTQAFVFFDPPYLCCGGVYKHNTPSYDTHTTWAEQLHKLHKLGGDFAVCCRVGCGAENMAERLRKDIVLASYYHNHYAGRGYYYADVAYGRAIERVITSLDMSGVDGWHLYM